MDFSFEDMHGQFAVIPKANLGSKNLSFLQLEMKRVKKSPESSLAQADVSKDDFW
jgi:hypothetical protein